MKKIPLISFALLAALFMQCCTVTFITGYDAIVDETTTKLKKDFNLFFIKLSRTLCTNDGGSDQKSSNFQEYYDNMEVDLKIVRDRGIFLGEKSGIVKRQIQVLDSVMHLFEAKHKVGFKDIPDCNASVIDDKRDLSNNVNRAIDGLLLLQQELKATGKIK